MFTDLALHGAYPKSLEGGLCFTKIGCDVYTIYIYICACVSVCMYLRKFVNKCICVYVKNDHRCTWVNDCESFIEEKIGCLNFSCVHQKNHHKNPDNFFIELYWKWDYALENEQYRHFSSNIVFIMEVIMLDKK